MITRRRLGNADAAGGYRLSAEAFGATIPDPLPDSYPSPGAHTIGAFDGDQLVAKLNSRSYLSHFAGAQVPTCGIAGVAVQTEYRGAGLLTGLFADAFAAARERGEVIATLFYTAPGIYRRFGFEIVGDYRQIEIPSAQLRTMTVPEGITLRRSGEADVDAIREVYTAWAAAQNGPLTRTGPSFTETAGEYLKRFTGVTLAVDAQGEPQGYVSWERGTGHHDDATIEVEDLIALTPDAARALWAALGSFGSVVGQVRVETSGDDVSRFVLPARGYRTVKSNPYMLSLIDVAGAFSARRGPATWATQFDFAVEGHFLESENRSYYLDLGAGGQIDCQPYGSSDRVYTARGIALAYAGVQSSANLRMAGLLRGGAPEHDRDWDLFFGGSQFHIRNYF